MKYLIMLLALCAFFPMSCTKSEPAKAPDEHIHEEKPKGPNGGDLYVLEGLGRIEVVFDNHGALVKLFLTSADGTKPVRIGEAPVLQIPIKSGTRRVVSEPGELTEGLASDFVAKDDSLKQSDIHAKLIVTTEKKRHRVNVLLHHDHEKDH